MNKTINFVLMALLCVTSAAAFSVIVPSSYYATDYLGKSITPSQEWVDGNWNTGSYGYAVDKLMCGYDKTLYVNYKASVKQSYMIVKDDSGFKVLNIPNACKRNDSSFTVGVMMINQEDGVCQGSFFPSPAVVYFCVKPQFTPVTYHGFRDTYFIGESFKAQKFYEGMVFNE